MPTVKYTITDKNRMALHIKKFTFDFLTKGATEQFSGAGPELKQGEYLLITELQRPSEEPIDKLGDNEKIIEFSVKSPTATTTIKNTWLEHEAENTIFQDGNYVDPKTLNSHSFEVHVQLKNKGFDDFVGAVNGYVHDVKKGKQVKQIQTVTLGSIRSGKEKAVKLIVPSGTPPGEYNLNILASYGKGEKNTEDNVLRIPIVISGETPPIVTPARYNYKPFGITFDKWATVPEGEKPLRANLLVEIAEHGQPESEVKVLIDGKVVHDALKVRKLLGQQKEGKIVDTINIDLPALAPGSRTMEFILDPHNKIPETNEDDNKVQGKYNVLPRGEAKLVLEWEKGIAARNKWLFQSGAFVGDNEVEAYVPVEGQVMVKVLNDVATKPKATILVDGKVIDTKTVSLNTKSGIGNAPRFKLGKLTPGKHMVTVEAKAENGVATPISTEITVKGDPLPQYVDYDYEISDIQYESTPPRVILTVPMKDAYIKTTLPGTTFKVMVDNGEYKYFDVDKIEAKLATQTQVPLPFAEIILDLYKLPPGRHSIEAFIDAEEQAREENEGNNKLVTSVVVPEEEKPSNAVLNVVTTAGGNGLPQWDQGSFRSTDDLLPHQDTTVSLETWNVGEGKAENPIVVVKLDGTEIARKEIETLPAQQRGTNRFKMEIGKLPSGEHTVTFELVVSNDGDLSNNKREVKIKVQSPIASVTNEHIYFGTELSEAVFNHEKAVESGKNIIDLKLHLVNSNAKVLPAIPLIIQYGDTRLDRMVTLSGRHNWENIEIPFDRKSFPTKIFAKLDIEDKSPNDNAFVMPVTIMKDGEMHVLSD